MRLSKVLSFALMATGTGITIGAYKKHEDIEKQKRDNFDTITSEELDELDIQDDMTSKIGRIGLGMVGTGAVLGIASLMKDVSEAKKLKAEEEKYAELDQRYVTREEFEALSKHVDEIRECHNGFVRHQWEVNKQIKGEVMDLVDSIDV